MKVIAALAVTLLVAACASNPPERSQGDPTSAATRPQPSAQVREAQQRLHTIGLYGGPLDGFWGPETQAAVQRFQQSYGVPVSARLDDATINAIRNAEKAPVAISDPTDVRTIQNRLSQLNFYREPADGVWGSSTQVALENFQRARGLPIGQITAATITALGLNVTDFTTRNAVANPATLAEGSGTRPPSVSSTTGNTLDRGVVRAIQQRLRQNGFSTGTSDGVWGVRTQNALVRFQQARGLEANGQLTPATISELGLDPNNLAASAKSVR